MTSLKSVNFEQIFQMALVNLNVILIAGIYMELVYRTVTKFLMLKMHLELYMLTAMIRIDLLEAKYGNDP